MFAQFVSEYGTAILYTLITAIFGYLGIVAKKLVDKYLNNKIKYEIAKSCVKFVEQVYKDLHGKDKLNKALEAAAAMLAEKGITVTDLEMRVLIESALANFNGTFKNGEIELYKSATAENAK